MWLRALKQAASDLEVARNDYVPRNPESTNRISARVKCEAVTIGAAVDVLGYPDLGSVGLSGVVRCKSIAECPVCARREVAERAEELREAVRRFCRDAHGSIVLVTLTCRHKYGDDLRKLRTALSKAWTRMWQGKAAGKLKARMRLEGTVRTIEATHGGQNGWHPHMHCLFFLGVDDVRPGHLRWIESAVWKRWNRYSQKEGLRDPERDKAVRAELPRNGDAIATYLAKMALADEVACGALKLGKKGRTHWQILASYLRTGNRRDGKLWDEWCRAMRNTRWMFWSHGFRSRWVIGADEERPDPVLLCTHSKEAWREFTREKIATVLDEAQDVYRADPERFADRQLSQGWRAPSPVLPAAPPAPTDHCQLDLDLPRTQAARLS